MAVGTRSAQPSDVAAVREFGRRVVLAHYSSIGLAEFGESMLTHYWDNDDQVVAIDDGRVLVAVDGDAIVGVAEFGDYDGELVLWKLYIDESHRGTGIGQALIGRVIEAAPPGTETLLIEHAAENVETGEIYEHLGFHVAWIDAGDGTPGSTTVWRRKQLSVDSE